MVLHITAYPYAVTQGQIEVPDEIVSAGYGQVRAYIFENFDNARFGSPELDYCGTEMEFFDEEGTEI